MSLGLIGRKVGMTRVFTDEGKSQPVTVIEVTPNRITQVRTVSNDGYDGVQVTTGDRRASRVSKAMKGHFAKAGVEPGRGVWEFRLDEAIEAQAGNELTVGLFSVGQKVDVSGQTIGKGFAGVIKRHGFRGGRATHGNSKAHRLGGSIGNAQDPGRVFKGKKMGGHMGAENAIQKNLNVVRVDNERNIILIAGSIPGSKGADIIIRPSVKSDGVVNFPILDTVVESDVEEQPVEVTNDSDTPSDTPPETSQVDQPVAKKEVAPEAQKENSADELSAEKGEKE